MTANKKAKMVGTRSQNTQVSMENWVEDTNGWRVQRGDGSYMTNAWYQNTDGKYYYMGANGYMLTNTVTPDGYTVNADGGWVQ